MDLSSSENEGVLYGQICVNWDIKVSLVVLCHIDDLFTVLTLIILKYIYE